MAYLVIMVLLAAAGITRLWLMQRRQRARTETVDGFWSSLERIEKVSQEPTPTPRRASSRPRAVRASGRPGRPTPLDPARRAAAKKRLEERRRAMARARAAG